MADFTGTFDFTNASDYTLSNTALVGDKLQLATPVTAGLLFSEDFANDMGFTYDSAKAEFSGGLVQQKDQTPTNSIMAGLMTTKDLAWNKAASITGTLNGTPTFGSGKMVCTGAQGSYYTKSTSSAETYKVKYTPNYTGAPPANINILSNWNGTNNNDRFGITHSPSGTTLRATLFNNVGGVVIAAATTIAAWSPVASTEYEIEAVINSAAGTVRIFVNGILLGTLSPGAWTRGTSTSRYYIGASTVVYNRAEGSFDDPIWFSNAQHTTSYTPGYTVNPFIYAETKVDLPDFTHLGPGTLSAISGFTTTEVGASRYIFEGQYWTGSAWVVSDGSYAQANDKATALTNLPSLAVASETELSVSAVLPDTNTQNSIDQLDVTYSGNRYAAAGTATIATASCFSANEMKTFVVAGETIPGSTSLKYGVGVDGVLKYWDGAAWSNSDASLAQLNTAAEVNANFPALLSGVNSTICLHVRLETSDNTVTSELDSMTSTYEFGGVAVTPATCRIWGYVRDLAGVGIGGATVAFTLVREDDNEYKEGGSNIVAKTISTTTASTLDVGYFEQDLIRSSEYEAATTTTQKYQLKITASDGTVIAENDVNGDPITLLVPDALDKDITEQITGA